MIISLLGQILLTLFFFISQREVGDINDERKSLVHFLLHAPTGDRAPYPGICYAQNQAATPWFIGPCSTTEPQWSGQARDTHSLSFFPSYNRMRLLFLLLKKASFLNLFSFWTLCLCLQHFHNDFLLLNKENTLDPIMDTFSTPGSTIGPADVFLFCFVLFFVLDNLIRTLRLTAQALQSQPGHTPHADFGAFPTFFIGIKVNISIIRGSGQSSFVRGCIVGQPLMVCQTLDHGEYLN